MTRAVLLATGLLVAMAIPAPVQAQRAAGTTWLCRPDRLPDPCSSSLSATVQPVGGGPARTERLSRVRRSPVDCFYVHPAVGSGSTPAAERETQLRAVARWQASRFSQICRLWAPVQRPLGPDAAYADVRRAWRSYLRTSNGGRAIVLLSHGRGTVVLRRLLREEVDDRPTVRRRLLSALLVGGNVTVRRGRGYGGDFGHIGACRSTRQTGCVVAFSMYGDAPPADSRFGRVPPDDRDRLQVLCTNPASLPGGSGTLRGYMRTDAPPAVIGAAALSGLDVPAGATRPWVSLPDHYTARCETDDGATVLRVTPRPGALPLVPVPDATWGLHQIEFNLALGSLTDLVRRQIAARFER
jgi:Protein of unknown function (DUF3089)